MNQFLQKAIDSLQINDVYLRDSHTSVQDSFEPKYQLSSDEHTIQFKHIVDRAETINLAQENGESETLLRIFISLGARWVIDQEEDNDQGEPAVEIEAQFIAEYLIKDELEEEAIDQFALKNASYHVWPYWREYLMNCCSRMNLPRIALSSMQLAQSRHQDNI